MKTRVAQAKKRLVLLSLLTLVYHRKLAEIEQSLGLTVFMVTHDLDSLSAITDRIAVLVDKKIKTGTIAEFRKDQTPWIHEYFSGPRGHADDLGDQRPDRVPRRQRSVAGRSQHPLRRSTARFALPVM